MILYAVYLKYVKLRGGCMSSLIVKGGSIRGGEVTVSGNKNAVLPMIAALMLSDEESVLTNVPDILDVHTMLDIAAALGAEYTFDKNTLHFRYSRDEKGNVKCSFVFHR